MEEEKARKKARIITIVSQLLLLVLFYFLIVWEAPDPPNPEYGIELSFISAPSGAASPQPIKSSNTSPEKPLATTTDQNVQEEVAEEVIENIEGNLPDDVLVPSSNESNEIAESIKEESISEVLEESDGESDVENDTNDGESITETEEEPIEIDNRSLMGNQGNGSSHNDAGNQSGKGANLSLAGWIWDQKPNPIDNSSESGKIVYNIIVDNEGYITRISVASSTVSPAVERRYRQSIENLTFSKTAGYQTAPISKGQITFIIQTK